MKPAEPALVDLFAQVGNCTKCHHLSAVNVLRDSTEPGRWGLAWYDKHCRLDARAVLMGIDFGNESTVGKQRAALARSPNYEPLWAEDQSYVRLVSFLSRAGIRDEVFLTNAALCVRPGDSPESGKLMDNQV